MKPFIANSSVVGADHQFWLNGIKGKQIATQDREIKLGEDNRAFVLKINDESTTTSAYFHDYLGGTVQFDVDVSNVDCGCSAGVYLTTSNDKSCTWNDYGTNVTPQCTTIDLLEANRFGFKTQTMPCLSGSCNAAAKCTAKVTSGYGPGNAGVDTTRSFHVKTSFWVDQNESGLMTDLQRIETTITQDDSSITIVQKCDILADLTDIFAGNQLAMSISTSIVGSPNEVSGTCSSTCTAATSVIKNVVWTSDDAINKYVPPPPTKIDAGVAPTLKEVGCGANCTECHAFYMSNAPASIFYECVDKTVYLYVSQCSGSPSSHPKCMSKDTYCMNSYPFGDPNRTSSKEYACRTLTENNKGLLNDKLAFVYRTTRLSKNVGICSIDCPGTAGRCYESWRRDSPE